MSLRPKRIGDYIGQEHVKDMLLTNLKASQMRNEALDHVLLTGPAGLGKTTLAQIIANELGSTCRIVNAAETDTVEGVKKLVETIDEGDVLFIDEIHRLTKSAEEFLYHPMEDGVYYDEQEEIINMVVPWVPFSALTEDKVITVKSGNKTRKKVDMPPFTLIGATTNSGALTKPLRDRFRIQFTLKTYSTEELVQMAKQKANMMGAEVDDDAAENIAKRSRGVARICVNFVKDCLDYTMVNNNSKRIDLDSTERTFDMLNVNSIGLNSIDIDYLDVLVGGWNEEKPRAFGIKTLSAITGEDEHTLSNVIEPYLSQIGFIDRTPRGRVATYKAIEFLNKKGD